MADKKEGTTSGINEDDLNELPWAMYRSLEPSSVKTANEEEEEDWPPSEDEEIIGMCLQLQL